MKGEYVEEKDHHPNSMFAKLHQTHNFQQQLQQQQQQPPLRPHHFQITACEYQTPEKSDTQQSPGGSTPNTAKRTEQNSDGATIEVVRRRKGRPPGSKNKPKPPVIITRDSSEPAMSPYVLEIPGGVDVVEAVNRYCRNRNLGICVLTASGTVANVTLRQPTTTSGATVTFHGRFDVLSLSATILQALTPLATRPLAEGFTISLAGPQGQVVGGTVVGPLLAAGTVYVFAASFNNPSYHRLPAEDEMRNTGCGGNEERSPHQVASGGAGDSGHPPAAESCGMTIYSSHDMPSDVIWAPTARQPPSHY